MNNMVFSAKKEVLWNIYEEFPVIWKQPSIGVLWKSCSEKSLQNSQGDTCIGTPFPGLGFMNLQSFIQLFPQNTTWRQLLYTRLNRF